MTASISPTTDQRTEPPKLRTGLHRRFTDEHGNAYVYVTASAAIMALDPLTEQLCDAFQAEARTADEVLSTLVGQGETSAPEALRDLVDLGIIRPEGEVAPPSNKLPPMPFPLATLVLNVTNKCNLSCTYCYEYGADKLTGDQAESANEQLAKLRPMMAPETARESIDFLFRSCGDRPVVSITFFGGETLLNFPTIQAAVEYAEEQAANLNKRVHFSLTTNATLLSDDVIRFLVAHRFGVTISIDGDQKEQDRHRKYKSGKGSFEEIEPRIRKLLATNRRERGRPVGARVTLTREARSVIDTYRFLVNDLGFDEVGFAPVTASAEQGYAMGVSAYDSMLGEFQELTHDFVRAASADEQHGFANLNDMLRELHHGVQKAHPCGAGLGLLGVSTEGELGLCHRFVESKSHAVGDVQNGVDEDKRSTFLSDAHVDNKADCDSCFARPLCAGGCYHEAHVRHADATKANMHACDWIRGWTDMGLSAYARIMSANPKFFARYESA